MATGDSARALEVAQITFVNNKALRNKRRLGSEKEINMVTGVDYCKRRTTDCIASFSANHLIIAWPAEKLCRT
jgi:hypothetical protein